MDGVEDYDGSRYARKSYPLKFSNPRKIRTRDIPYARPIYDEDSDDLDEEMDPGVEDSDDDVDFERHPKKRKLKNLIPSYEFAPRARNLGLEEDWTESADWTERAVFVLLEVWGDKFVQLGRKSLRSEDWQEVTEKVGEILKIPRTETQCRKMLDSLKRRYKKEKTRMEQLGMKSSKWAYLKKMEILMDSPARQDHGQGLACGLDSGEFVFADTRVYLDRSNGLDEMRDSPVESENSEDENETKSGNDWDELPLRRARGGGGGGRGSSSSFRMLADSVQKFEEIYGNVESNKRQQLVELEKMRKDFYRELELQKKQILERTQAQIAKIREEDDEDEEEDEDEDDGRGGGGGGGVDTGDSAEDLSE